MSDNISNDEAEGNLQHPNSGLRHYKKNMNEKQGPTDYQSQTKEKPSLRNSSVEAGHGKAKELVQLTDQAPQEQLYAVVECNKFGRVVDPNFDTSDRVSKFYQEDNGQVVEYQREKPLEGPIFGLIPIDKSGKLRADEILPPKNADIVKRATVDQLNALKYLPTTEPIATNEEFPEYELSSSATANQEKSSTTQKPSNITISKRSASPTEKEYALVECNQFGRVTDPQFSSKNKVDRLYQRAFAGRFIPYDPKNPLQGQIFGLLPISDEKVGGRTLTAELDGKLTKVKKDQFHNITVQGGSLANESMRSLDSSDHKPLSMPENTQSFENEQAYAMIECNKYGRVIDPNFTTRDKLKNLFQLDKNEMVVPFDKRNPLPYSEIFGLVEVNADGDLDGSHVSQPKSLDEIRYVQVAPETNQLTYLPTEPSQKEADPDANKLKIEEPLSKKKRRKSKIPSDLKPEEKVFAQIECDPLGKVIDPNFSHIDTISKLFQKDADNKIVDYNPSCPLPGSIFGLAEVDDIGDVADTSIGQPINNDEVKLVKVDGNEKLVGLQVILEERESEGESEMPLVNQMKTEPEIEQKEGGLPIFNEESQQVYAKVLCNQFNRVLDPNFMPSDRLLRLHQEDEEGTVIAFTRNSAILGKEIFGLVELNEHGEVDSE